MEIRVGKTNEFKTIQDAVIRLRSEKEKKIIVENGTYFETNLFLTKEDSGLEIAGENGRKPVLVGGCKVSGFEIDEKTGWFFKKLNGTFNFRFLMTDTGKYLQKARYPEDGFLQHLSVFDNAQWKGSCFGGWGRPLEEHELNRMIYKPEDIPEDFEYENAYVQVFHVWNESCVEIKEHDKENNTFIFDPPCGHPPGAWKKTNYVIYNTKEGMTKPGSWYFDKKSSTLFYKPLETDSVDTFCVIVPTGNSVINLDGCEDVTISNLHVSGATTPVATEIFDMNQDRGAGGFLSLEYTGAINGENIKNVTVTNVDADMTGGWGIKLAGENIRVSNCSVKNCGAGGIGVRESKEYPKNGDAFSYIEGCRISFIGIDYYSGPGIFIDKAKAKGNYISDTPYSGIVAYGNNVVIEDNYIKDIMTVLEDGGGIYKLLDNGGIIRNNVVLETRSLVANKVGIYLDAPGNDWHVYGNVVKGFSHAMHSHIGASGTVWENNYFESYSNMKVTATRTVGISLKNNIFKCAGNLDFMASKDAFKEFDGNIMICRKLPDYVKTENKVYDIIEEYTLQSTPENPIIFWDGKTTDEADIDIKNMKGVLAND